MRPRMYGSTDIQVLRTSSSPGPGPGSSVSTRRKSDGLGSPSGRAARWISRVGCAMAPNIDSRPVTDGSPTAADAVGTTLAAHGVDTVFGVVGSGNFVATNAIRRAGGRFLAARHEGGAICMADGWARATARVGVASVHQGPGLTNTMT